MYAVAGWMADQSAERGPPELQELIGGCRLLTSTRVSTQSHETGECLVQEMPLKIPGQEALDKRLQVQQKPRDKWDVTSARCWITELKAKKKNQERK